MTTLDSVALELTARALSRNYGVAVRVEDTGTAYTEMATTGERRTIVIPNVESDDPNYTLLVRGYIDHEAAHCRFTDVAEWPKEPPLLQTLCNIYEDCFVERQMAKAFVGCGKNLRDLSLHMFRREEKDTPAAEPEELLGGVLDYCIIAARSVDDGRLVSSAAYVRGKIEAALPGLPDALEDALRRGGASDSTMTSRAVAQETLDIMRKYVDDNPKQQNARRLGEAMDAFAAAKDTFCDAVREGIGKLAESGAKGSTVRVRRRANNDSSGCGCTKLPAMLVHNALKVTAALDSRLHGLLQTIVLNRGGYASHGRLDCNRLHRVVAGNGRAFARRIEKVKVNTEIVLCVDMSGSMGGDSRAMIASGALFAIMTSLRKLPGVQSSAIGFGGKDIEDIIKPDEMMHRRMRIDPCGGTLCGEALVHAATRFSSKPDARRIVVMLTDGESSNEAYFSLIVKRYAKAGIELYGICVRSDALQSFMAPGHYRRVDDLAAMPSAFFDILHNALVREAA